MHPIKFNAGSESFKKEKRFKNEQINIPINRASSTLLLDDLLVYEKDFFKNQGAKKGINN